MTNDVGWGMTLDQESPDHIHIPGTDGETRITVAVQDIPSLVSMLNDAGGRNAKSTNPTKEAIEVAADIIRNASPNQSPDKTAWKLVMNGLTPQLLRSLADDLDNIVEAEIIDN
ncbi:hypothetical protein [Rhodococcus qingshengii]|uniref:hypothetical protein n=1 Tax=Rhodococcus qingshengii TaxID=334542 RepID=UPI0035DDF231